MKSSKVLSVRIPKGELSEIEQRAAEAGLPLGTYVRTLLHRERVDSAAAIAILSKQVEAQHAEVLGVIAEQQQRIDDLKDQQSKHAARTEQLIEKFKELANVIIAGAQK
jgi:predicted DNA binding CopG/RHH family protein